MKMVLGAKREPTQIKGNIRIGGKARSEAQSMNKVLFMGLEGGERIPKDQSNRE